MYAFLAVAVLAGSLLAVQAAANVQLTRAVGTPFGAAAVQLSIAAGLVLVLAGATGVTGVVRELMSVPFWQVLGGLASPLYITTGILLLPRLGALAAMGLFVTGQVLASLILDLFGLLGVPGRPISLGIVIGVVAVLAGIATIVHGQHAAQSGLRRGGNAVWALLGVAAGAALPVQAAVNARLLTELGEPLAVALTSFAVAVLGAATVLAALLLLSRTPMPQLRPTVHMPWWGWLGGACAAAYVTTMFMAIPRLGAATTVALTVAGQQIASAVVDGRGYFRMARRPLTPLRLGGVAMLTAGSALVQLG